MEKKITHTDLKKTAGGFATGVTIITSKKPDGTIVGMTASSFVSVSFDPPLVSFFVDKKAKFFKHLGAGETFGISILNTNQQKESNHFAGYPDPEHSIVFDESKGFPLIKDSLAWYITKAIQIIPTGDHHMALCSIEKLGRNEESAPLLYFSGKYL